MALKVHRDMTEGVTGLELPISFLRAADGALTGGVSFGWRSDEQGFAIQFLIGPTLGFSIF
jgi:hypothetical protein